MAFGVIENISISGISCALPTHKVNSVDRYKDFGKEAVDRIIEKTGVKSVYKCAAEQTASDLAYVAAKGLMEDRGIDPKEIGALVFVTQTPDYKLPATAFVLQHRLNISKQCICYDINLGCSGYVNGLFSLASIMNTSNVDKALLLVAETPSKRISPLDRSMSIMIGDCGTATLLEKKSSAEKMLYKCKSLGDSYNKIIVPAGASRNKHASRERVQWADGNIRSLHDTYMNGQDVFAFSITTVPSFVKGYLSEIGKKGSDYDYIILHQANMYILEQIAKRLKVEITKTPASMELYGNTTSASIPLTIAFLKTTMKPVNMKKLLMVGFGVGLSIAVLDTTIDFECVLPIVHTDDYYKNGSVSRV